MLPDLEKLRAHVQEKLSPERYRHSIAVQKAAMSLAKRHGADWYKAGVAGLVHDICKGMDEAEQLNYLRACGILPDILTLENPPIWHAMAAACYAEDALGIDDQEILDAVRYHATGRADMSLLEKVVYVADLISEAREFEDAPMMRKMAENTLDGVIRYSLRYIIHKVVRQGNPLVQDAWEAYNFYILDEKESCQ